MCVTELTDQVMCQTSTVRTNTPQTSRLSPNCIAADQSPVVAKPMTKPAR